MTVKTVLHDASTSIQAKVSPGGALRVAPERTSLAFNAEFAVDDVAVEIVAARAGEAFCITGVVLTGNKNIDQNTDAVVTLFEATADDQTTSLKDLFIIPVARSAQAIVTSLILGVPAGRFIMGKTTDDDVFCTIIGYYLD